ncbi:MAG: T9SS type A sorting domain-containing protein, partial [Bacteroidetes bacterium]|nr:T9SS type A sorting domain-containing protein [Bacteroidota bacterium]
KELENVLFVKYRIINTGSVSNVLDSVIFSAAADPDIGDYVNDLMGSDIYRNSGFGYDQGIDQVYLNSPAFFITLVQGAKSYIPGKSFADNNSNGIFDDGIDTPLDTAFHLQGNDFQYDSFAGAANIGMTSFIGYTSSHPTQGDPSTIDELRNYQRGLGTNGEPLDPCNHANATVEGGVDCSSIDPHYYYSGDPVNNIGWIYNFKADVRICINSGYFTLKKNEPIEIIYAYLVGRGTTSIESITEARKIADVATNFYRTNFSEIVVDVEEQSSIIPKEFSLYQNYPNPFNPRTVIKFHVPSSKFVKLLVFDILGREVATLVNEYKTPGIYEFSFDASLLASGLYFYQLTAGSFSQTKKMMLLK